MNEVQKTKCIGIIIDNKWHNMTSCVMGVDKLWFGYNDTTPNKYLNRCWLIVNGPLETNLTELQN